MSRAAWHEVGEAGGPEGSLRRVEVEDRAVCVARTADGWIAFDDTCTHEECSLAEGELDGTIVICPCHGSEFDVRTGDVMTPPALDPLPIFDARDDG
ncbi:MAG TPA: Rieske 2Fe-2S domain-containing protein, partial [Gaiella sp.]|nr:Rieske 2Fe-2S domain-containing protein [Gaiella sp.]